MSASTWTVHVHYAVVNQLVKHWSNWSILNRLIHCNWPLPVCINPTQQTPLCAILTDYFSIRVLAFFFVNSQISVVRLYMFVLYYHHILRLFLCVCVLMAIIFYLPILPYVRFDCLSNWNKHLRCRYVLLKACLQHVKFVIFSDKTLKPIATIFCCSTSSPVTHVTKSDIIEAYVDWLSVWCACVKYRNYELQRNARGMGWYETFVKLYVSLLWTRGRGWFPWCLFTPEGGKCRNIQTKKRASLPVLHSKLITSR